MRRRDINCKSFIYLLLWLGLVVIICPAGLCSNGVWAAETEVRPSVLAGSWYPGDPDKLTAQVNDFLSRAQPAELPGRLVALTAPHAGYVYSGQVAAYGFSLLAGQNFETIVLVGPSHRAMFPGVSVNLQDYDTPLGRVPVDRELAERIIKLGGRLITSRPEAHAREHCLEIELPFLQVVLGTVKIVPILMGDQDIETCRNLGRILAESVRGKNVLLLVSTDLSHFHTGAEAKAIDGELIEMVKAFDPEGLHQGLANGRVEACGGGALVAVMMAARDLGADQVKILKYAHSGDVTGDQSRVVGYLAVAFTSRVEVGGTGDDLERGLASADRERLLTMARQAITAGFEEKEFTCPDDTPPSLKVRRGAFVTLKRQGVLRGCIGRVVADEPLADVVTAMAKAAAFQDPRFPPLTKEEYQDISLEISVLTPFSVVNDLEEIQVGVHGLMIEDGYHRGLLLPQVPVEQGWNKQEFLDYTCRKAGLPEGCWREGARIFKFSALVFGEKEHGQ